MDYSVCLTCFLKEGPEDIKYKIKKAKKKLDRRQTVANGIAIQPMCSASFALYPIDVIGYYYSYYKRKPEYFQFQNLVPLQSADYAFICRYTVCLAFI